MNAMKELYEKVSKDAMLQEKFSAIIQDAEQAGEAATRDKLIDFAKEAGYDVPVDEMQEFFKDLMEKGGGELSDAELDQVAGGKSAGSVLVSIISFGVDCALASIIGATQNTACDKELDNSFKSLFTDQS